MLLLEHLLDALASLLLLAGILDEIHGDGLLQLSIEAVAGGHDMGEVDKLDEGLDAGATLDLLGAHGLGDLEGVALDAADEGRGELLAGGLVVLFEG